MVKRARQLIIRLSGLHPAYDLLLAVRRRLQALWREQGDSCFSPQTTLMSLEADGDPSRAGVGEVLQTRADPLSAWSATSL